MKISLWQVCWLGNLTCLNVVRISLHRAMQESDHLYDATSPEESAALDALWMAEALDRLAAYGRGEITSVPLSEVLRKYQSGRPIEL